MWVQTRSQSLPLRLLRQHPTRRRIFRHLAHPSSRARSCSIQSFFGLGSSGAIAPRLDIRLKDRGAAKWFLVDEPETAGGG